MTQDFEIAFRTRTAAFVDEIDGLVRRSVFEAVQTALGTRLQPAHADGASAPSSAATATVAAPRAPRKRRIDPVRRDALAIAGPLVELLRAEGGLRFEEITARTRMAPQKLGALLERLVKEGRIALTDHRQGARFVAT